MALFAFLVASLGICLVQQPARAECRIPQSSMTCGRQPVRCRRAYTARCGAEFFRRLCPADGDLRPAVCLGRKRRFLAGDHQLLFVWTGSVFPLQKSMSAKCQ